VKETTSRSRRRWKYNIKIDLKIRWKGVNLIDPAQNRDRWRALVNEVMNFRVAKKMQGISRLNEKLLAFKEGLCSMDEWRKKYSERKRARVCVCVYVCDKRIVPHV